VFAINWEIKYSQNVPWKMIEINCYVSNIVVMKTYMHGILAFLFSRVTGLVFSRPAEQVFRWSSVGSIQHSEAKRNCLTCEEVQCVFHRTEAQRPNTSIRLAWVLSCIQNRGRTYFNEFYNLSLQLSVSGAFYSINSLKKTLWPLTSMVSGGLWYILLRLYSSLSHTHLKWPQ